MLEIDGSQGEGGGQVLRTCLSLSALSGRPFRIRNIRAGRSKPGLRPQHLTAVRAAADICNADTRGDALNSQTLIFAPQSRPPGGTYLFDVTDAANNGSAGSVTLILQTLLWPLFYAEQPSLVRLRGGTHVPFSPPFHFISHVYLAALKQFGVPATAELTAWGWYPRGQGEITFTISPGKRLVAPDLQPPETYEVEGVAAATNLPSHIPQRMARRAANLLDDQGISTRITPLREKGSAPGAGIFLWTQLAGFSSLGRPGLPAEKVASSAVADCLSFVENRAAVGSYLADQLLLPLALSRSSGSFTTSRLTSHTYTNAQLLRIWLDVEIELIGAPGESGQITVEGSGFSL
jgi:RNA 3'-terminal phosphate cyclase (ATP)